MKNKILIAEALMADFQENTLTFEITSGEFSLVAGEFAIVPKEKFDKLLIALRGIAMSVNVHPDNEADSEFEGMVQRSFEALDEIGNYLINNQ